MNKLKRSLTIAGLLLLSWTILLLALCEAMRLADRFIKWLNL